MLLCHSGVNSPYLWAPVLTAGCDGVVSIWDGEHKKRLAQFTGYPTSIAALAFNLAGNLLAVASSYTFEKVRRACGFGGWIRDEWGLGFRSLMLSLGTPTFNLSSGQTDRCVQVCELSSQGWPDDCQLLPPQLLPPPSPLMLPPCRRVTLNTRQIPYTSVRWRMQRCCRASK